jgi:chromosome segregation ATPase
MSVAAIKRTSLSDGDKTSEYEVPAEFVVKKVQDLKTEQNKIETQIEAAKVEPVVRQQDENTQVFNLRQMQLVQKIKELEAKKQKTEKDINSLQTQKNSQLHNDLKKVAQVLMNETKSVSKITNLKEDMQELFEVSSMDRKNALVFFENQSKDLAQIKKMIEACTVTMTADYSKLSAEIQPLLAEKVAIEKELIPLRSEYGFKKAESDHHKAEIEALKISIAGFHERINTLGETEEKFKAKVASFEVQTREMENFEEKKAQLTREVTEFQTKHTALADTTSRLQISVDGLSEVLEQKRNSVLHLEAEIFECVKRLNDYREQEVKFMESAQNHQTKLSEIRSEIEQLSGARTSQLKMQEDALQFLNEKRAFYSQELKALEENHTKRMHNLDETFKNKTLAFTMEFDLHQKTAKAEMEQSMVKLLASQMENIKSAQEKVLEDMVGVVKKHLSKTAFESEEVKADQARIEISEFLESYLNQGKKSFFSKHFWKWSTLTSVAVTVGLCFKIWF